MKQSNTSTKSVIHKGRLCILRNARRRHQCSDCSGTIEVNEQYVQMKQRRGSRIIGNEPVCLNCWDGPTLTLKSKKYKYRPKWKPAVADGAEADLRKPRKRELFKF